MEQIDSDYEYRAAARQEPGEAELKKRFNWLYVIPILGSLWLLFLFVAAVFQVPISAVVNPIMTIMILIFLLMGGLLFWALAPKSNR